MIEDGKPMGCSDSGPPVTYSEDVLSRALDLVYAIKSHVRNTVDDETVHCNCRQACNCIELTINDAEKHMIMNCIPERMRFEMTWSKWQYRSR